ncbi:hypothetical protein G6F46_015015 [Rhizopus delemar]|uniref:Uncharacterized protein n=1 Tax=Rhizopus delemar TaxID=936053 RepID=A0A9P6XMT7_9FUNG|nr:hypothetical protein G6F35_010017 [Rhizopus arrhizus]KAG1528588.1 hypothetical protein G6F50_018230 [Rhizopus delemar]KAG1584135.1 hypothetical protein G6F46_015015 [Rhizopus delemar]
MDAGAVERHEQQFVDQAGVVGTQRHHVAVQIHGAAIGGIDHLRRAELPGAVGAGMVDLLPRRRAGTGVVDQTAHAVHAIA